jgi:hypothetical protein
MRGDNMQPEKNVHLSVPSDLVTEMEAAAKAENKTPDEWAAEAFARHLESTKWQELVAFGHEHARKHGFKEEDVPRFIAESRDEQRGR